MVRHVAENQTRFRQKEIDAEPNPRAQIAKGRVPAATTAAPTASLSVAPPPVGPPSVRRSHRHQPQAVASVAPAPPSAPPAARPVAEEFDRLAVKQERATQQAQKNVQKRGKHDVAKLNAEIKRLKEILLLRNQKIWRLDKRCQRMKRANMVHDEDNGADAPDDEGAAGPEPLATPERAATPEPFATPNTSYKLPDSATPVKEADSVLRSAGISPSKAPAVRKHLSMGNVACQVVAEGGHALRKKAMRAAAHIKTGRLMAKALKASRKKGRPEGVETQRTINHLRRKRYIAAFLVQPENSTCLPGTCDTVTVDWDKEQKYILNNTLLVLHKRYVAQYPQSSVSLATFKKARPENVLPQIRPNIRSASV